MQCLTDYGAGSYSITSPQPVTYTDCTAVVAAPSEISNPAWNLTVDEATPIATAILLCWAAGLVARLIIQTLNGNDRQSSDDD